MFDHLVEWFSEFPYLGVGVVFLLCGLGLPLPEEIVLIAAGYVCFRGLADRTTMMLACTVAIMIGDLIPFALGRWLGLPLLRLRPMRFIITPQRLARFNRWFRKRGNLVIFFSRFVAGIRVVAYFTAGTLKMSWTRFLLLDIAGIALIVPPLIYVGDRFGGTIDSAIGKVQQLERGILITIAVVGAAIGLYYWMRWRKRQRMLVGKPTEAYVEPSKAVQRDEDTPGRGDGDTALEQDASPVEPPEDPPEFEAEIAESTDAEPSTEPEPRSGTVRIGPVRPATPTSPPQAPDPLERPESTPSGPGDGSSNSSPDDDLRPPRQ